MTGQVNRDLKLLFVTTVIETADAFLSELAEHLKQHNCSVDLMTNAQGAVKRVRPFDRIIDVRWNRGVRHPLRSLQQIQAVRRTLSEGGYHVVHTHTPTASALTRIAGATLRNRPPIVYTAHGFHFGPGMRGASHYLAEQIEAVLLRQTDLLITINDDDYNWATNRRCDAHCIKSRGVGVSDSFFGGSELTPSTREKWGVSENAFLVLSVGELSRRKRPELALESVLRCHGPRVLMYVGDGEARSETESLAGLAVAVDPEFRVIFTGRLSDLSPLFQAADALVHTARQEGLPTVVLEAMASRLPVAAFRIRGCTDLLGDGRGILAPNGDAEALADALNQIRRGGSAVEGSVAAARAFAEEYRRSRQVREMANLYNQVAEAYLEARADGRT